MSDLEMRPVFLEDEDLSLTDLKNIMAQLLVHAELQAWRVTKYGDRAYAILKKENDE